MNNHKLIARLAHIGLNQGSERNGTTFSQPVLMQSNCIMQSINCMISTHDVLCQIHAFGDCKSIQNKFGIVNLIDFKNGN